MTSLVPVSRSRFGALRTASRIVVGAIGGLLYSSSPALGIGYFAVAFTGAVALAMRQQRQFLAANNEGLALLARGDLDGAHAIFARWADTMRISRLVAVARTNLAWTLIRQGRPDDAIVVIATNEARSAKGLRITGLWPSAALHRAMAHALAGRVDPSTTWLETSAQRASSAPPAFTAMTIYVRAILLCRRDDPAAAAKLLADEWAACEGALTGDTIRPMRILRAYALAAADPRSAGPAEMELRSLAPRWPAEFAFLGATWPAMHTFLTTHALLKT